VSTTEGVEGVALDEELLETGARRPRGFVDEGYVEDGAGAVLVTLAAPPARLVRPLVGRCRMSVGEPEGNVGRLDGQPSVGVEGAEPHTGLAIGPLGVGANVDFPKIVRAGEPREGTKGTSETKIAHSEGDESDPSLALVQVGGQPSGEQVSDDRWVDGPVAPHDVRPRLSKQRHTTTDDRWGGGRGEGAAGVEEVESNEQARNRNPVRGNRSVKSVIHRLDEGDTVAEEGESTQSTPQSGERTKCGRDGR